MNHLTALFIDHLAPSSQYELFWWQTLSFLLLTWYSVSCTIKVSKGRLRYNIPYSFPRSRNRKACSSDPGSCQRCASLYCGQSSQQSSRPTRYYQNQHRENTLLRTPTYQSTLASSFCILLVVSRGTCTVLSWKVFCYFQVLLASPSYRTYLFFRLSTRGISGAFNYGDRQQIMVRKHLSATKPYCMQLRNFVLVGWNRCCRAVA